MPLLPGGMKQGFSQVPQAMPASDRETTTSPLLQGPQAIEKEPGHGTSPGLSHHNSPVEYITQPHKPFVAKNGNGREGQQKPEAMAETFVLPLLPVFRE